LLIRMNTVAVNTIKGMRHEVYSGNTPNSAVFTNQKSGSPASNEAEKPAIAYPPSDVNTNDRKSSPDVPPYVLFHSIKPLESVLTNQAAGLPAPDNLCSQLMRIHQTYQPTSKPRHSLFLRMSGSTLKLRQPKQLQKNIIKQE
jgi:hypothetical protein